MSPFPIANVGARAHVVIVHVAGHWSMKVNGEPLDGVRHVSYEAGVDMVATVKVEFYAASVDLEVEIQEERSDG